MTCRVRSVLRAMICSDDHCTDLTSGVYGGRFVAALVRAAMAAEKVEKAAALSHSY